MSKRRLVIEIDAEAETCGECDKLQATGDCYVFGDLEPPAHRHAACLAAESAARPWEGDPDNDDGTPMHLQIKGAE